MSNRNARQLRDNQGELLINQSYDAARDLFQPYFPDWDDAVAMGMINGCTRAFGIGYNPDIDTAGTPEDCWGGDGLFNFPNALTSMQIRSTDANDTAAGTGLRTLTGNFLDGNYLPAPQTLSMNGLTPVPLSAQILANNGLRGLTAGSVGTNVGTIILEALGGGTIYGVILPGIGVSNQAPFTVPAGQTLVVPQIVLNVNTPGGGNVFFAQMRTWFRFFTAGNDGCAIQPLVLGCNNGIPYPHLSKPPIMVPEKSRFSLRVNVVTDNNTGVTAGWNGYTRSNTVNGMV